MITVCVDGFEGVGVAGPSGLTSRSRDVPGFYPSPYELSQLQLRDAFEYLHKEEVEITMEWMQGDGMYPKWVSYL